MPLPPLTGVRVLLTRAESDGMDEWAAALASAGATPVLYPTTVVVPPASWAAVDASLARFDDYDWLIFTSQTAVAVVLGRLADRRFPSDLRARIAAVGDQTARAIQRGGGLVALVPIDQRQEGLVRALADLPPGTRVLLPLAEGARTLLADDLRSRGCRLDVVTVYQTRPKRDLPPLPPFDVATFASPSSLRAFLAGPGKAALAQKGIAVIGPTTAREAAEHGLPTVVAESPNADALVRAVVESHAGKGDP